MKKISTVLVLIPVLVLFIVLCYYWYEYDQHNELQEKFTMHLEQVKNNFEKKLKNDTIDFALLTPFPWDTVYVFEGYNNGEGISDKIPAINWAKGIGRSELIPENTDRYIFVYKKKAEGYVDISLRLGTPHFRRYNQDELGRFNPDHIDGVDNSLNVVNCFTKKDAKFILVCGIDIVSKYTTDYKYVPLELFQQKAFNDKYEISRLLYLHPVSGCGYSNCLANK